jgi:hypothetical protein
LTFLSNLEERDFERLAISVARMRQKRRFPLVAWVLLPDHGHGGPAIDRVRFPPDEKARI